MLITPRGCAFKLLSKTWPHYFPTKLFHIKQSFRLASWENEYCITKKCHSKVIPRFVRVRCKFSAMPASLTLTNTLQMDTALWSVQSWKITQRVNSHFYVQASDRGRLTSLHINKTLQQKASDLRNYKAYSVCDQRIVTTACRETTTTSKCQATARRKLKVRFQDVFTFAGTVQDAKALQSTRTNFARYLRRNRYRGRKVNNACFKLLWMKTAICMRLSRCYHKHAQARMLEDSDWHCPKSTSVLTPRNLSQVELVQIRSLTSCRSKLNIREAWTSRNICDTAFFKLR